MPGHTTASVVIEWDNARLAELDRAREMLRRLYQQIPRVAALAERGRAPVVPVEVLVTYDGEKVDAALVEQVLDDAFGREPAVSTRLVPVPGADYFELKNAGARTALGDVVVFLDSDAIPEHDWLEELLGSFATPGLEVVGGAAYIDGSRLWDRAFALFWFFPQRADTGPLRRECSFFANNVAFRRETFLRFGFPRVEGTSRAASVVLRRALERELVPVYQNPAARVGHPAPSYGLAPRRAVVQGRDQFLLDPRMRRRALAPVVSAARLARELVAATDAAVRARRRSDLRRVEVPAVVALAAAYHGLCFLGELATLARPRTLARLEL